jgi:hypothetical protein
LLDAAPANWRDGEKLLVDAVAGDDPPGESFEQWQAEMAAATAGITDEDHDRLMAALDEAERESKELGRREMERAELLFADDSEGGTQS